MTLPDPKTTAKPETVWHPNTWPLVIAIEDCFVPQSAQLVIEVAREQREETHAILWALAGMKAREEICRN